MLAIVNKLLIQERIIKKMSCNIQTLNVCGIRVHMNSNMHFNISAHEF